MANAQVKPAPTSVPAAPRKSTLAEQSQVALTVYNSNIALVKEQREIDLAAGENTLQFTDVAAQIIPTTVHVKSLSDPQALHILEQNYEYDLLNPEKLLEKFVGKEVKLFDKNYYSGKDELADAILSGLLPAAELNNETLAEIASIINHEVNVLKIILGRKIDSGKASRA